MKHLKEYTNYHSYTKVKYTDHAFLTGDLLSHMGLDVEKKSTESIYGIDVAEYLKEIYLNKKVQFNDKTNDKWITGIVTNVNLQYWVENTMLHIIIKVDGNWYRISETHFNKVYDYDAKNKPEHIKLKMIKDSEKYNV